MAAANPNLYWPVYQNLERSVQDLTYSIHMSDDQLIVYSSEISSLILRAATEIESISKDLYKRHGGEKTSSRKIKFDYDAIEYLNSLWTLDQKVVIISSENIFLTDREIRPFEKSYDDGEKFEWNDAYQSLKHDRSGSMSKGNVHNLLQALAALYVLNLYYRAEEYELGSDALGSTLPAGLGSVLLAPRLHPAQHDGRGRYRNGPDFDECLYYIDHTPETHDIFTAAMVDMDERREQKIMEHPTVLNAIAEAVNAPEGKADDAIAGAIQSALGPEVLQQVMVECAREARLGEAIEQLRWVARVNCGNPGASQTTE